MLFHKRFHFLPYLIYLSIMDPALGIHWTGFGILVLLLQNREEWNLWVLPAILLILLPSLYLSWLDLSLAMAVLMSYPLAIKPNWINERNTLILATIWLALLAFIAGPLVLLALILALLCYLPFRPALLGMLALLLLWILPLGRSNWKLWLGQVQPSSELLPLLDTPPASEPLALTPPSAPAPAISWPWMSFLEHFSEVLLFLVFGLVLVLLLRILWMMRRQALALKKGLLLLLVILVLASVSVPTLRWLGQHLSQQSRLAETLPPSNLPPLPDPMDAPITQAPADPSPESMPAPPPTPWVYREIVSLMGYILMLLGLCVFLLLVLRLIWKIPLLPRIQSSQNRQNPNKLSGQSWKLDPSWKGSDLLIRGYEMLRERFFPNDSSLTPLELRQKMDYLPFSEISETYMRFRYARQDVLPGEETLRGWIKDCLRQFS